MNCRQTLWRLEQKFKAVRQHRLTIDDICVDGVGFPDISQGDGDSADIKLKWKIARDLLPASYESCCPHETPPEMVCWDAVLDFANRNVPAPTALAWLDWEPEDAWQEQYNLGDSIRPSSLKNVVQDMAAVLRGCSRVKHTWDLDAEIERQERERGNNAWNLGVYSHRGRGDLSTSCNVATVYRA